MAFSKFNHRFRSTFNSSNNELKAINFRRNFIFNFWQKYPDQENIKDQQKEKCPQEDMGTEGKYSLLAERNDKLYVNL
jgi:predicted lipase